MKLIDLKIDEIPFKWREKIIKFNVIKFWLIKGGYKVHPELILLFNIIFNIINKSEGINNQNLKLFNRGNKRSEDININGRSQFLSLPMIIGIVIKKIIINAWIVIII